MGDNNRAVRMGAIRSFWSWLASHQKELRRISSASDPLLDDLLERLRRIDEGLSFEVSTGQAPCELVVSAQGDAELFSLVDHVVSQAPELADWVIVGLKPPLGFAFSTDYEGIALDPSEMWFLPLERASDPSALGLRVGVPGLDSERRDEVLIAVHVMLETGLGERASAESIEHVEVVLLPSDPADLGFIELPELAEYLEWRRRKSQLQ